MSSLNRIYLDHAATTPVDPLVLEAMLPYLTNQFGNPSSLHQTGKQALAALNQARKTVASCIGAQPEEILFTSGATEADNLAILGVLQTLKTSQTNTGRHLITTQIEHAAVAECFQHLENQGWEVTWLPVDSQGFVQPETLIQALRDDTVLVSIIHGNNEIGTLQDIATLGQRLKERQVLFHVDAVQTIGKLPINLNKLPVDYLALSAHKLYGPKGVGALYVRQGAPQPSPLILGGGQEQGLRSGTENLAGIVGLAKALEMRNAQIQTEAEHLKHLQSFFIEGVEASIPEAELNGPHDLTQRVPGNVHFSFPGYEGETLVLQLDMRGISTSSGSACHSATIEPSRIVKALGKNDATARGTVRFSIGKDNTEAELEQALAVLTAILKRMPKKTSATT